MAEERPPPGLVEELVAVEHLAGEGEAFGLGRGAHQRLRQCRHVAPVGLGGGTAPAPLEDRGQEIGKDGHGSTPITRSGSQVAMPGKRQSSTIPATMQPT